MKHGCKIAHIGAGVLSGLLMSIAGAAPLNIADVPLFLPGVVPPLNMLVMSRDHRMFYEAYNDASDLDGNGTLDSGYRPTEIDYYGYFDSFRCYTYAGGLFSPATAAPAKTCAGATEWSGDWLNYVTMSRIDAMRKVLYGGLRSTDTATDTVLQRAFIPQDAHSWGKEYTSVAVDGYDIQDYTPLDLPAGAGTRRHLFANTTPAGGAVQVHANPAINGVPLPLFRVLQDQQDVRVWNWLSIERPVAGTAVVTGINAGGGEIRAAVAPTDYVVRVQVCASGHLRSARDELPVVRRERKAHGLAAGVRRERHDAVRPADGLVRQAARRRRAAQGRRILAGRDQPDHRGSSTS